MIERNPKKRGAEPPPQTTPETRPETSPETRQTSRAGQAGKPGKPKLNWKTLLAAAIAVVIVWQLYHAFIAGGKASHQGTRGQPHATTGAPTPAPLPQPTPTPTVPPGRHPPPPRAA